MNNRPTSCRLKNEQVSTAVVLAAGIGSRLAPLTDMVPKCLVPVNEIPILERLIHSLQVHKFKRLVIVVGHQADRVRKFLGTRAGGMEISYITSLLYKTTNNIYSLWLARNVIEEPFLLLESDLVFDPEMLRDMLHPDRIAVARLQPWMNGTTVTINGRREIEAFCCGAHSHGSNQYKTVNIYSLSTGTWQLVRERLQQHIGNGLVNGYYETVFADMVSEGCLSFTPVLFDANRWYEVDTIADLRAAEQVWGLHHRPAPMRTDHMVSQVKGQAPSAPERPEAIGRIESGSRRRPGGEVSAPMTSGLTRAL
jgi:choline kinase